MGTLNNHSPIFYMKYAWENWLNLRDTPTRMYLASILEVQDLRMRVRNDAHRVM